MSDSINNEATMEETVKKGATKISFNFFNNIVNKLNLNKINQANTLFLVLICIYFFVIILLIIINPPALKGFAYSKYLSVGFVALIIYSVCFFILGNVKKSGQYKQTKNE